MSAAAVKRIDVSKTDGVDWEFEIDSESQKATSELGYTDEFEGWLERAPEVGSEHPDYGALKLTKIKGKRLPGLQVAVTLSYATSNPEAAYPGRAPKVVKRYSLQIGLSDEPLLTFPAFAGLGDTILEALAELISSEKSKDDFAKATAAVSADENALKAIALIRKGTEAYLVPKVTWLERYTSKTLPPVAGIGKIATPPGSPPEFGDRTWLNMGYTANHTENAEAYEIEHGFDLSGPGGWDTTLYGTEEE